MTASSGNRHGQVLVAVDGSPASLEALRYGHRMAQFMGAQLTAVTAWQPLRHGILPPTSVDPYRAAEQLIADSILEAFHGSTVPEYDTVAVEGDAAEGLIRLSRDADLLVIGSRGHAGLTGALLGSVSGACAAHAHCPVTVVHTPVTPAQVSIDTVAAADRVVVTF